MDNDASPRLRDFQQRLAERLRNASESPRIARLGLAIGERRWLVELVEAGEIVPIPTQIAPVPNTRDWFRGLVNLRGTLFGVSDLQRFAGEPFTPVAKDSRLLALSANFRLSAALIVSRMLGLHDPGAWREEPQSRLPMIWAGRCLVDPEGRQWHELSLSQLASDEQFLSVGR